MDKCSKCLNRKNCIDGANYKIAEKCNKYRPESIPEWEKEAVPQFHKEVEPDD